MLIWNTIVNWYLKTMGFIFGNFNDGGIGPDNSFLKSDNKYGYKRLKETSGDQKQRQG